MSDLVERLAEKREGEGGQVGAYMKSTSDEARWWLNAIAEELEADAEAAFKIAFTGETFPFELQDMAKWLRLRSQAANDGGDDG